MQGFSGGQVDGQTRRQTKGKQCFIHVLTLPDYFRKLSWAGQRFVKKL
jgi:hypothetical protein